MGYPGLHGVAILELLLRREISCLVRRVTLSFVSLRPGDYEMPGAINARHRPAKLMLYVVDRSQARVSIDSNIDSNQR